MLKELRLDVILLIIITAVVCLIAVNQTAHYRPLAEGIVGITDQTLVEWGGAGLGADMAAEATAEPQPDEDEADEAEADAADEAEAEPTEEAGDE
jgi:hypothetical protein